MGGQKKKMEEKDRNSRGKTQLAAGKSSGDTQAKGTEKEVAGQKMPGGVQGKPEGHKKPGQHKAHGRH
jgi:hypothetical protein